jgi:acyl-CoA synthetase (AMP-forming)/AMP-acid ligase II
VSEASVFGVPDERLGEVPAAVVYCEKDPDIDEEALLAFLNGRIAQYKLPSQIWVHKEPLPKLGTGKIDKKLLRERYQDGQA